MEVTDALSQTMKFEPRKVPVRAYVHLSILGDSSMPSPFPCSDMSMLLLHICTDWYL
jgi:hypothetical protein